jgi:hypothetical protein
VVKPRHWSLPRWAPPDSQKIDALMGEFTDPFMLHYNMPPFATGETGRVGTPSAAKSATAVWPSVR